MIDAQEEEEEQKKRERKKEEGKKLIGKMKELPVGIYQVASSFNS